MNYKGKVAIITGAGKGIGCQLAIRYANEGASVILAEIDSETGKETENLISGNGGNALFVKTDVSDHNDIEELFKVISSEFKRCDILINNAGISIWKSPLELSVNEWDKVINTNLRSTFLCSREAAKLMKENGGGSIINIASTRAFMSEPGSEAYAATKGGIVALTHALAASFAEYNIRVNCISPGWIETGDYSRLSEADHKQHFSGRVGKPEDIAKACFYLTAPENEFINGTNIIIDGGMTRKMIYV